MSIVYHQGAFDMYHVECPPGGALFHIDAATLTVQKVKLEKKNHLILTKNLIWTFKTNKNKTNFKNHILLCKLNEGNNLTGNQCARNPVNAFKMKNCY